MSDRSPIRSFTTAHLLEALRRQAALTAVRSERLQKLVRTGLAKLSRQPQALGRATSDAYALLRLCRAWANKRYRDVPWRSLLYAVTALLYFVNPLDAIPDALLTVGYIDDLAVLAAVIKAIRFDLDAFLAWERAQAPLLDASAPVAPLPVERPKRLLSWAPMKRS